MSYGKRRLLFIRPFCGPAHMHNVPISMNISISKRYGSFSLQDRLSLMRSQLMVVRVNEFHEKTALEFLALITQNSLASRVNFYELA